jgi:hypothetical protein
MGKLIVAVLVVVGLAGCGSEDSAESPSGPETTLAPPSGADTASTGAPTTVAVTEATSASNCGAAMDEAEATVAAVLDQADALETLDSDVITSAFESVGQAIAVNCTDDVGVAVSRLIVFTAGERAERTVVGKAFIDSFLPGLCDLGVELTPSANIACSGAGEP